MEVISTDIDGVKIIVPDIHRDARGYFAETYNEGRYGAAGINVRFVQDTETGEYYRAENGFTDWYDGTRYRPATDNAAYLSPVSGYINWK